MHLDDLLTVVLVAAALVLAAARTFLPLPRGGIVDAWRNRPALTLGVTAGVVVGTLSAGLGTSGGQALLQGVATAVLAAGAYDTFRPAAAAPQDGSTNPD